MTLIFKYNFIFFFTYTSYILSQNIEQYLPELGGTLCRFLGMKTQIHRKQLHSCPQPACSWDNWQDALHSVNRSVVSKPRIVLSYAHNGFGNQLWQHTIAFMVAENINARLYISMIPDKLCFDGATPPNTFEGMSTMEKLLPQEFLYDSLDLSSKDREVCEKEEFFLSDRPKDWRNSNYSSQFKTNFINLVEDKNLRCIKMLGYFQSGYPLCRDDVRRMWTPKMFNNYTIKPSDNDISIYLRCMPRHYHFNEKLYYEAILNRTSFDKIWLFQAPECPTKLSNNPSKDGAVPAVIRFLQEKYNATRWPKPDNVEDDSSVLLHDLAGLAQSKKMILPASSWAFWAGLLSNATEIHVSVPHHMTMPGMSQYIYHNEKAKTYYGKYNDTTGDIIYHVELNSHGEVVVDDYKTHNQTDTSHLNSYNNTNLIESKNNNKSKISIVTHIPRTNDNITVNIDISSKIDISITSSYDLNNNNNNNINKNNLTSDIVTHVSSGFNSLFFNQINDSKTHGNFNITIPLD